MHHIETVKIKPFLNITTLAINTLQHVLRCIKL